MRKYLSNTIMILGSLVLISGVFYVFSVYSYAGNQNNSSGAGNVTAIILCENGDSDHPEVDHSQIAINADGCVCSQNSVDINNINCADEGDDDGESCAACLGDLQRAGLTIIQANEIFDTDSGEEKMHYLLTGNAGPFLIRVGTCPCPL